MNNLKFHAEYELRASPKMLYPYISTAAGLQQWFADKVTISPDHVFDFLWDKENIEINRTQFVPDDAEGVILLATKTLKTRKI